MLERIIAATSNPGDVVLDPFCGRGTTIDAAQKLGREWIGIDITHLAITLIKNRLADTYGAELKMKVNGEPEDVSGARELAAQDKYQFQWCALGLVGARSVEQKKGADGGVDGKVFFLPARRAEGNVAGAWSPLEAGGTTGSPSPHEHAPRQGRGELDALHVSRSMFAHGSSAPSGAHGALGGDPVVALALLASPTGYIPMSLRDIM